MLKTVGDLNEVSTIVQPLYLTFDFMSIICVKLLVLTK